ncbi:hypothetical protein ScalyP_jg6504 [Parmales sp. scaly parma]|nr:hypothetical protein ScalyP_jg6504 [Parmales sp. scaly parma]
MAMKLFIKVVMHVAFVEIYLEACWQIVQLFHNECQIRERTHVIVAITFCQKLVAARFMAGSATSVAEAVVFEICGLIAEVVVINQYLRGFTPWMKLKMNYRSATKLFFSKKTSVAPDTDLSDDNCDSETEGLRLEFCAYVVLYQTLCEGICIFAVVAYVLIIPVSFGPAGSARIERSVVLTNAAIMVVGELFVSDLVILLASRYLKKFKCDRQDS